jgi:tetratricopeptide (TPR) repeat protein
VDPGRRGRALAGLGQIAFRAGETELAIERLQEALDLLGDAVVEHPAAVITLGNAYSMLSDFAHAIAVHERALALAGGTGDRAAEGAFAVSLANILIDRGNFTRAEELLAGVLREAESAQDLESLARLYWSQSRLHVARGAWDAASRDAARTLALLELSENQHGLARAHHLLAYIEIERGHPEEALELLERALPLVRRAGDRFDLAQFRLEEARALAQLGRADEARTIAEEVQRELARTSSRERGRAIGVIAEILADTGDRVAAIELYESSIKEMAGSPFAVDVHRKLAELLEAEGRQAEALEVLKRAVALQAQVPTEST